MQLIDFFPNDELIRKHVAYYRLFNYEENYIKQTIFLYPHYLTTLALQNRYLNVFSGNEFSFRELKVRKPYLGFCGGFTKPIYGEMNGRIKALSIIFKPAGSSFFCDKPFGEIVPHGFNYFPLWDEKLDELEELLYCSDTSEITEKLDTILLSLYRPFENVVLFESLSLLHDNYADYTVGKLERTLGINRKTLSRCFKKHTGFSITDYRRVLRFREVINRHSATPDENLTRLAYETCFSDQSHFIKDFRKLTGDNPQKLFKEAGFVGESAVFLKAC